MRSLLRASALVLSMSLGTATLAAQSTIQFHAGASLATLGGSDVDNPDTRTGLNVGATMTFPVAPLLGIQVGAGYVQKGATESDGGVSVEVALDYVEVPVLLRVGVPTAGTISPHFVVGAAVAFKSKCEVTGSSGGTSVTVKCSDGDIMLKSTDFGAVAGAGLDIGTPGPLTLTLDVAYTIGLTSIDDSTDPGDVKNRAWSIVAGAAFPIG